MEINHTAQLRRVKIGLGLAHHTAVASLHMSHSGLNTYETQHLWDGLSIRQPKTANVTRHTWTNKEE